MYLYKPRDQVLFYLHPVSLTLLTLVLVVSSFLLAQPLLLAGLLVAVCLDLWSAGLGNQAKAYFNMGLFMAGFIILINLLFNHHGSTVIYRLHWSGIGELNFTLEVLVFAVAMSLRLLIMLEAFCLFTYLVNPDQIVKYLSRWGGNTALALAITLRLLPGLVTKAVTIREIQSCRGVEWDNGGIIKKLRNSLPLMAVLLGDSLEGSMQLAQSLQTRGFGVGKRVIYNMAFWSLQDTIFSAITLVGMSLVVALTLNGQGGFVFYPRLEPVFSPGMLYATLSVMLTFSYPAILSGGWRLWHSWKLIT